jgi:hypothetical protein
MVTMRSIEVAGDRVKDIRSVVPVGTEHYVLASGGSVHVNVRTSDDHLFRTLEDKLRSASCARQDDAPFRA